MPFNSIDSVTGSQLAIMGDEDWWSMDREDEEKVSDAMVGRFHALDQDQSHRRESHLHYLRMYSARLYASLGALSYSIMEEGKRLKVNVIKAAIDTGAAHIATAKVRPFFLTEGARRRYTNDAEGLNKFMRGQFHHLKQDEMMVRLFVDAGTFGEAHEYIYEEDGIVGTCRVPPTEILVDESESKYGEPRTLWRHVECDKQQLKAKYEGKKDDVIDKAALLRDEHFGHRQSSNLCSVVISWRLPSKPGADDGMYCIGTSGGPLEVDEWKSERFPIRTFMLNPNLLGWGGIGWAEELTPFQVELNFIAQKQQELINAATTQMWAKKNDIIKEIDNENMGLRHYRNAPPTAINVRPWTAEMSEWREFLFAKAFQQIGLSQLDAMGVKPAGIEAGVAFRQYTAQTGKRFQHVVNRVEDFTMEVAEEIMERCREIEERGDGDKLKIMAQDDKTIEEISWSDVSKPKNKYIIRPYPASFLPETPAGKFQAVVDLRQLSPELAEESLELLSGIPDLEAAIDRVQAPIKLVEEHISDMLDRGEAHTPIKYMDLERSRLTVQRAICYAYKEEVEPDRIRMLENYLDVMDQMIQDATPTPQGAPGTNMPGLPGEGGALPPGGAPVVPPGPLPVGATPPAPGTVGPVPVT